MDASDAVPTRPTRSAANHFIEVPLLVGFASVSTDIGARIANRIKRVARITLDI
jgi:hypothetical protein